MKCSRCLLRLLGRSVRFESRCDVMTRAASCSQPGVLRHSQQQLLRRLHTSPPIAGPIPAEFDPELDRKRDRSLVAHDDLFEQVARDAARTKATFSQVVEVFTRADVRRRGHVEFIYAALRKMEEFGVERDLAVYNQLLDVFPKEVFVPRNFIQRMFNHYPRQQECGVQLLEQMENYGIMPNVTTKVLLHQIFGEKGHPMRKYQRIMYWFPKFKNVNPFPVPHQLPEDPVDLARFSLSRMASDRDAKVTVYQLPCTDITESGEEIELPHIVGIQSPDQMELLSKHNVSRPVFVEGPFPLWLRKTCVYYYILRADPTPPEEKVEEPYDPERCLDYPLQLDLDLDRDLGDDESFDVEDVDEGPVFGMCMTGRGDQATLNQWISGLQQSNPVLGRVPTLFRLDSGPWELQGPAAAADSGGTESESGRSHRPDDADRETREWQEEEEEETRRSQRMK